MAHSREKRVRTFYCNASKFEPLSSLYTDVTRRWLNGCPQHNNPKTYPRIKNFTVDDNLPAVGFPPDNGHVRKSVNVDFGALDMLPLELLQATLSQLDLYTLKESRRVNQRAREIAQSIPQYKEVTTRRPCCLITYP